MQQPFHKEKAAKEPNGRSKAMGWSQVRKTLEKRFPTWIPALAEPTWLRWALIVAASFIAAFMMAPSSFRAYHLTPGEPARETIVSPVTFQVIDEAATAKNRDEALKSALPVYDFDDEMVRVVQERLNSGFALMRDYISKESDAKAKTADKSGAPSANAEKKSGEAERFTPLDEETLRTRFETELGANVPSSTFQLLYSRGFNARIQQDVGALVIPALLKGVVLSRELLLRDGKRGIHLWVKSKERLELLKDVSTIFDYKEAVNFVNLEDKETSDDPALSRAVRRIASDLINVNISYNRERSQAEKQKALDAVKEVSFTVARGEPIISKGEPVSELALRKLETLIKGRSPYNRYTIVLGVALIFVLLLRMSFRFSEKHLARRQTSTVDLFVFCLLLLGSIVLVSFLASLGPLIARAGETFSNRAILFFAPLATGSMLVALMIGARTAFMFTAVASVAAALAVEGDAYMFCFYFISGLVGLHGITRVIERAQVLRAGLWVALANVASALAIKMALGQISGVGSLYECLFGLFGGLLSGLLVLGLTPLLEPLGYTTNVKLLELANLNHPLLKRLAMEAPGTYHHSIMVGNLAEAAAELIGANPLLARVGAYYHDVGKIGKKTKPTYFIENQGRGPNPHDKLEPSMSALILVSHVKHGVEKAREYRLGAVIEDIIRQHHGTSLIRYFYNKALEKSGRDHTAAPEDKYHYPGPPPQTKEAALVMMGDIVEAACRTLNEPTPARIQKMVQALVLGLFTDGQLDQSTLTLKDLHAVTRTFVRSLQGVLHARIEYPEDARAAEKHPKIVEKANGDNAEQQADKDRARNGRNQELESKIIRRLGLS
jgi:hypothetical protein